ncbi:MAG: hypothetical protein KGL97_16745 [Alphaproteobacteria bacterium]|nr:hypothetical protein [Alphaproteobacteria bacterium]
MLIPRMVERVFSLVAEVQLTLSSSLAILQKRIAFCPAVAQTGTLPVCHFTKNKLPVNAAHMHGDNLPFSSLTG